MSAPVANPDHLVLVVEDDPVMQQSVVDLLTRNGIASLPPVATGSAAISQVKLHGPAAVILDIDLADGVSGLEVAERLGAQNPALIIFLSGRNDLPTLDRAGATFPFAFLSKPADERQLTALVHGAFRYRECLRAGAERSGPETELITICAWCRKVRSKSGEWLGLADFIIGAGVSKFTHGICRPCGQREMEKIGGL
jgi:FixJ family two-component response regulator